MFLVVVFVTIDAFFGVFTNLQFVCLVLIQGLLDTVIAFASLFIVCTQKHPRAVQKL